MQSVSSIDVIFTFGQVDFCVRLETSEMFRASVVFDDVLCRTVFDTKTE